MKLENTTPLAVALNVSSLPGTDLRLGCVTAKATYCFDGQGAIMLDLDDPFPIFEDDVETELGLLPHDQFPRQDPAFEVILLGAAHAPGGKPTERMTVSLSVGDVRRELVVTGDRNWIGEGNDAVISRPEPFTRMPLTWDRAYGGTAEVLIDVESPVEVAHPLNPEGRGFDPEPMVDQLANYFTPPEGFPCTEYRRQLPNVEAPDHLISSWSDQPEMPAGWATMPQSSPMQMQRAVELPDDGVDPEAVSNTDISEVLSQGAFLRSSAEWILRLPAPEVSVVMQGLTTRTHAQFKLPPLRVLADYRVGDERGCRELIPQMLIILPDEGRFSLLLRRVFMVTAESGLTKGIRIRLEEGWFAPTPER